ncbi:hypothetical protein DH2020_011969 [Rehmannia glutinosa]|uniref:Phosphate transporter PHO1-like protein n=1 Tax=Rehmannia glutinosa TaxID=99300 RepID=A0ABR0XF13_REHGL
MRTNWWEGGSERSQDNRGFQAGLIRDSLCVIANDLANELSLQISSSWVTNRFEGELVPEWKEAFVDYSQLKKDLKEIHLLNNTHDTNNKQRKNSFLSSLRKHAFLEHNQTEHRLIQVHKKLAGSGSEGDLYETQLLEQFTDSSDAAIEFFACLDHQLNKVNQFFRTKENEFLERGDSLKKQMEILVELKTALNQTRSKGPSSQDLKDDYSISGTISCDEESIRDNTEQCLENSTDELDKFDVEFSDTSRSTELGNSIRMKKEKGKMRSLSGRIINCRGKSLRIHIPLTNPTRTFSAISYLLWDDLTNQSSKKCGIEGNKLHINRKKLHHAEKMIKGAFLELYKGLGYLKTYRNLNMLAFVKILKKFDRVTSKQILPIYLRVVESSYFNSSDKALKLADEVEGIFVKHFAGDDKRKAMKYLKPTQKKNHILMFSLLFLHVFLYGCNIVMWRKTRINYSFIFELSPTKELKYRDVFLICTSSMAVVVGIMFVHLSLVAKGYSYAQVQAIPGLLLLVHLALVDTTVEGFLLVLVCPFNIIYKSSRYRFLSVIRNIILTPLYKVVMLDFFMADQLCSQVPMLRELEYVACYYITGSYKTQDYQYCMRTTYYRDLAYAVSFLPYYWRAMQCARRWFDEGHKSHLVNLGKYVSAMLAAGAKVAYEKEKNNGWLCVVVVMSSAATLYQLYWDFVKDWGLLQLHSKNPWLRDELMLRQKLENEHLNNAGKFRAVKTVPLPFHEVMDEQD